MKTHAFVRTNAGKVVRYQSLKDTSLRNNSDKHKLYPIPSVKKHLYFLFAPTLIYRDEYPRYFNSINYI